jgi:hypothetical protein
LHERELVTRRSHLYHFFLALHVLKDPLIFCLFLLLLTHASTACSCIANKRTLYE